MIRFVTLCVYVVAAMVSTSAYGLLDCRCNCCLESFSSTTCFANETVFQVQTCQTCTTLECLNRYPQCGKNWNNGISAQCLNEESLLSEIIIFAFLAVLALLLAASVLRYFVPQIDQLVHWGTRSPGLRHLEHAKLKRRRMRQVLGLGKPGPYDGAEEDDNDF
jgi:hypothetical protein